jgi:hypothetical protein
MPPGGATFDKITVPLGQGGTSGEVGNGNHPTPALRDRRRCAPLSRWLDPSPTNTALQPPRRGRWPRHPLLD